jgi:hypothetical protein
MGKIRIANYFDHLSRLKANFLCPPLIKVETFLTPPPQCGLKQVCVAGKVRYKDNLFNLAHDVLPWCMNMIQPYVIKNIYYVLLLCNATFVLP